MADLPQEGLGILLSKIRSIFVTVRVIEMEQSSFRKYKSLTQSGHRQAAAGPRLQLCGVTMVDHPMEVWARHTV